MLIDAGANLDAKTSMSSTARDFIRNMFSNSALPAIETRELRDLLNNAEAHALPSPADGSSAHSPLPRRSNRM